MLSDLVTLLDIRRIILAQFNQALHNIEQSTWVCMLYNFQNNLEYPAKRFSCMHVFPRCCFYTYFYKSTQHQEHQICANFQSYRLGSCGVKVPKHVFMGSLMTSYFITSGLGALCTPETARSARLQTVPRSALLGKCVLFTLFMFHCTEIQLKLLANVRIDSTQIISK